MDIKKRRYVYGCELCKYCDVDTVSYHEWYCPVIEGIICETHCAEMPQYKGNKDYDKETVNSVIRMLAEKKNKHLTIEEIEEKCRCWKTENIDFQVALRMPVNMDELQFRKFNIKDTYKCAELVIDAWPSTANLVLEGNEIKLASAFIDSSRSVSTWLEVVCVSEEIIGFLFGRIDSDFRMKDKFKAFFSTLAMIIKLIIAGYGRISRKFTLLRKFILTEIKVRRNRPKSDGEITAFVVDSKYRGKGIGRMLMDRFIQTAKSKKVKIITVYTSEAANWKFYEIYGFRRYSTFYDDLASYVENKDVKSFIYAIDLQ